MRVAIVQSTPAPPAEGIGNHTFNLARQFRRRGHDPHVFTRGGWTGSTGTVDGVPVTRPACPPLYPLHAHVHRVPLQRALAREGPFDVVHLHSPLVPVPSVSTPTVATVHTPIRADVDTVPADAPGRLRLRLQVPFSAALEGELLRRSDAVTCVSESVRGFVADRCEQPVEVVNNGVDVTEFQPGFDEREERSLLYAGRLGRRKGLPRLLAVAGELRDRGVDFSLRIAGKGPLEEHVEETVRAENLQESVELLGYVDRDELLTLFRRSTMLVHLPEFEGLPTTVLEAMASGAPVVATDVPGCRDAIVDGRDGVLVPRDHVAAIGDEVVGLIESPERRRRLGTAARARVEAEFDWKRVSSDYLAAYRRVVA